MIEPPKVAACPELHARSWGPAVAVVLICASIALLLSFDAVYERLQWALSAAQPSIAAHPRLGAIAFVLFAALSAILACFSSALLPAAVFTWGTTVTRGLLWLGWLLGGLATSALGREFRRPRGMVSKTPNKLDLYLQTTQLRSTIPRADRPANLSKHPHQGRWGIR